MEVSLGTRWGYAIVNGEVCHVYCEGKYMHVVQATATILGFRPTGVGNSMLQLGRPVGRLNFNMELPIPVGRNPNIDTAAKSGSVLPY